MKEKYEVKCLKKKVQKMIDLDLLQQLGLRILRPIYRFSKKLTKRLMQPNLQLGFPFTKILRNFLLSLSYILRE